MTIQQWLNGNKDYIQGVELFFSLSKDQRLRKYFEKGKSNARLAALEYQLRKLSRVQSANLNRELVQETKAEIKALPEAEAREKIAFLGMPADLQEKYIKKGTLAKNASAARKGMVQVIRRGNGVQVLALLSPEEMRAHAESIVTWMDENQSIWDQLRYFQQNGHTKPDERAPLSANIESMDTVALHALISNLAPWCSKEKKRIATIADEASKNTRQNNLNVQQSVLTQARTRMAELKVAVNGK